MKVCPKCSSAALVKLSSLNCVMCADCKHVSPWDLKPNQPPIVCSSRDKRLTLATNSNIVQPNNSGD